MDGEVVVVTGATSGLGEAAAAGFARLGATVWLVVRNAQRGEHARARLAEQTGSDELLVATCDLSEMRSVRRFAAEFGERSPRLDVLVNNAGVLTPERSLSADGIELTLATNVLGPFLLTKLLVPVLESSAPSRRDQRLLGLACTRRGCTWTTYRARRAGSAARSRTRAASGSRSSSPSSGPSGCSAPGWW